MRTLPVCLYGTLGDRLRAAARDRREGVQEVVRAKRLRERISDCLEKSKTLGRKRS